jgi:hypothetical protein
VNMGKAEIRQLEKALAALVCRPRLIRRDYWVSEIECLLASPGLSAQDRQRLGALLVLLATPSEESGVWLSSDQAPGRVLQAG